MLSVSCLLGSFVQSLDNNNKNNNNNNNNNNIVISPGERTHSHSHTVTHHLCDVPVSPSGVIGIQLNLPTLWLMADLLCLLSHSCPEQRSHYIVCVLDHQDNTKTGIKPATCRATNSWRTHDRWQQLNCEFWCLWCAESRKLQNGGLLTSWSPESTMQLIPNWNMRRRRRRQFSGVFKFLHCFFQICAVCAGTFLVAVVALTLISNYSTACWTDIKGCRWEGALWVIVPIISSNNRRPQFSAN